MLTTTFHVRILPETKVGLKTAAQRHGLKPAQYARQILALAATGQIKLTLIETPTKNGTSAPTAGFVKDVKRIQVLPIPEKIATKLKEVLTQEQIIELIKLLSSNL